MDYETTIDFDGDFNSVVEAAINTLQPHGFEVINNDDTSIELKRIRFITPKHEKPIMGISHLKITLENNSLIFNTDLSKLEKTHKIMSIFSIVIDVIFLAFFGTIMVKNETPIRNILLIFGLIISCLIIGIPMMKKIMKKQAAKSFDDIVKNLVNSEEYM